MTQIMYKNGNTWGNLALDAIYPIGSIYTSTESTSPAQLFGGTWSQIKDTFLLAAGDTYSAGNTGGAATVTLTSAQSGIPAHAHGLNSHKHTIPEHGHTYTRPTVSSSGAVTNGITGGSHGHTTNEVGVSGGIMDNSKNGWAVLRSSNRTHTYAENNGAVAAATHTHNLPNHTHALTGGSVANKAAFDSEAASGNTASNTAANASQAHENMPPYLTVYCWKRTA